MSLSRTDSNFAFVKEMYRKKLLQKKDFVLSFLIPSHHDFLSFFTVSWHVLSIAVFNSVTDFEQVWSARRAIVNLFLWPVPPVGGNIGYGARGS